MSVNRNNDPLSGSGEGAPSPQRERPLVARSVIASILLPLSPPALTGQKLVRAGELFGIAEGTSRVALSRMVGAGELEVADGTYSLTGRLLERQARQNEGRRPKLVAFDGQWVVAAVTAERRRPSDRAALRVALGRLRLAELREGVWLRPDNLRDWRTQLHAADPVVSAGHCVWFHASLAELEPTTPSELARRLWDLDGWAGRATELRRALAASLPGLEANDTAALAPGFRVAAAVVRQLTSDPLLPDELLPTTWPAAALRAEYDRYERAYWKLLRDWLSVESTLGSRAVASSRARAGRVP